MSVQSETVISQIEALEIDLEALKKSSLLEKSPGITKDMIDIFKTQVNQLLATYKEPLDDNGKISILKDLLQNIRSVEINEIPKKLANDACFHKLKTKLFSFIKNELAKVNIKTLLDPRVTFHDPKDHPSVLAKLIADMRPDKADKLMEMLSDESKLDKDKLKELYEEDDFTAEACEFREFLKTHLITFLGGNNSKNYKVENTLGGAQVLKVDNRLNMPRHIECQIRDKVPALFLKVYADRQTLGKVINPYTQAADTVSRTILVTEYSTADSRFMHAVENKEVETGIEMGIKMIQVYLDLQSVNCFFPDSKFHNFQVKNDKLIVADTKSLLFSKNGKYTNTLEKNKGSNLIRTSGFDVDFKRPYTELDIEKVHAGLLGRNLYCYLTGKVELPLIFSEKDFNLEDNPFKTAKGEKLKKLILSLTKDQPNQRISLLEAQKSLHILAGCKVNEVFSLALENLDARLAIYLAENDKDTYRSLSTKDLCILLNLINQNGTPKLFDSVFIDRKNKGFEHSADFKDFFISNLKPENQNILLNWAINHSKNEFLAYLLEKNINVHSVKNDSYLHLLKITKTPTIFQNILAQRASHHNLSSLKNFESFEKTLQIALLKSALKFDEETTIKNFIRSLKSMNESEFTSILTEIVNLPDETITLNLLQYLLDNTHNSEFFISRENCGDLPLASLNPACQSALLHWAINEKKSELVSHLIDAGVEVKAEHVPTLCDLLDSTPSFNIFIKLLIEHSASIDSNKIKNSNLQLILKVRDGDKTSAETLIKDRSALILDLGNEQFITLLSFMGKGTREVFNQALNLREAIDFKSIETFLKNLNQENQSSLMEWATIKQNTSLVNSLIENGVSFQYFNKDHATTLFNLLDLLDSQTVKKHFTSFLQHLGENVNFALVNVSSLSSENKLALLQWAIENKKGELAASLIEKDFPVNDLKAAQSEALMGFLNQHSTQGHFENVLKIFMAGKTWTTTQLQRIFLKFNKENQVTLIRQAMQNDYPYFVAWAIMGEKLDYKILGEETLITLLNFLEEKSPEAFKILLHASEENIDSTKYKSYSAKSQFALLNWALKHKKPIISKWIMASQVSLFSRNDFIDLLSSFNKYPRLFNRLLRASKRKQVEHLNNRVPNDFIEQLSPENQSILFGWSIKNQKHELVSQMLELGIFKTCQKFSDEINTIKSKVIEKPETHHIKNFLDKMKTANTLTDQVEKTKLKLDNITCPVYKKTTREELETKETDLKDNKDCLQVLTQQTYNAVIEEKIKEPNFNRDYIDGLIEQEDTTAFKNRFLDQEQEKLQEEFKTEFEGSINVNKTLVDRLTASAERCKLLLKCDERPEIQALLSKIEDNKTFIQDFLDNKEKLSTKVIGPLLNNMKTKAGNRLLSCSENSPKVRRFQDLQKTLQSDEDITLNGGDTLQVALQVANQKHRAEFDKICKIPRNPLGWGLFKPHSVEEGAALCRKELKIL